MYFDGFKFWLSEVEYDLDLKHLPMLHMVHMESLMLLEVTLSLRGGI